MSKAYTFEFSGTKQDFLNILSQFTRTVSYSGDTYFYFDDYIVKLVNEEIHFGVARGGHSGGYWFVPTITYLDGKMEFQGEIRYIGPEDHRGIFQKIIEGIDVSLLVILLLPIYLIIGVYRLIEWLVRKIINRPKPKAKTEEERLFDLMENYFGCVCK